MLDSLEKIAKSILRPVEGTDPLRLKIIYQGHLTRTFTVEQNPRPKLYNSIRKLMDLVFCLFLSAFIFCYHALTTILIFLLSIIHSLCSQILQQIVQLKPIKPFTIFPILIGLVAFLTVFIGTQIKPDKPPSGRGYQSTESVSESFFLYRTHPTKKSISKLIRTYQSKQLNRRHSLSNKILIITKCFKIDPWIFTSLIAQESAFDPNAVGFFDSKTPGGFGLTQFTHAGIKEVNYQTGFQNGTAQPETVKYFDTTINKCILPQLKGHSFRYPWEVTNNLNEQKRMLLGTHKDGVTNSLIYGGVLLKTLLAVAKSKEPNSGALSLYKAALTNYNGDKRPNKKGVEMRVHYQRSVLKKASQMYRRFKPI